MPPADVAVRMAAVLGLSVEYLVTGREIQRSTDISKYIQFKEILDDLSVLPVHSNTKPNKSNDQSRR